MKIQEKTTATIAITLFAIIFITSLAFTQLFVINDRNMQLSELVQQNKKFAIYMEEKFNRTEDLLKYLGESDYYINLENIIGVNILITDQDINTHINTLDVSDSDLKKILASGKPINTFFTISDMVTRTSRNDFGQLVHTEINNSKYYVSMRDFIIEDTGLKSIFLKKQNDIAIPPLRYLLNLSFIFLVAGIISLMTGIALGKSISGPILKLNRSVSRISDGDYSENIKSGTNDEIGLLARNINSMKRKIQKSQESLKEFTLNLSHEIKNMITSISGYASGISEGIYSSKEEIDEALAIIRSKTKDLENITESLLMLSSIENRILEVSREEIKITDIVDDTVKLYDKELERNMLVIKKAYDLPENLKMMSDKYLVQTVISNLINNAIKYSPAQSKININLFADSKGGNVSFMVSNRGQEITKTEKDKIFNMFYRSKQYDFKNIKGFGLGLAISKKISVVLGAKLDFIRDTDNNTFVFKIPVK